MVLRGVGPESEAESVRFRGHRVTKMGGGVKYGLKARMHVLRKLCGQGPLTEGGCPGVGLGSGAALLESGGNLQSQIPKK